MAALIEPRNPWVINALPSAQSAAGPGWLEALVGQPPEPVASELKSRDFLFLARGAAGDRAGVLAAAEWLIDRVPPLSTTVRALITRIFLLSAREEYDVSHSEPRWPHWIFVSVPRADGVVSSLRLAENVVHEAMHLQLTALEARISLVGDADSRLHSPWKQEPRQFQGVLHGLYVFACISAFFRELLEVEALPDEGVEHIHRRLASIHDEMAAVSIDRLAGGLTHGGRRFLASIQGQVLRPGARQGMGTVSE